ncbi:hypothetical protein Sjap_018244 [Stephania japonica]|uniref:Uncharacterized protein n=1 Tax=Stephania japonica TaxID=461633 RepID=A0AAP0NKX5_9MAGN
MTNPVLEDDIKEGAIARVLGKERHGRVRGLGNGVTLSSLNANAYTNGRVKELEDNGSNSSSRNKDIKRGS